jgi:branched-chain amino acid transport system substrate-binding protein
MPKLECLAVDPALGRAPDANVPGGDKTARFRRFRRATIALALLAPASLLLPRQGLAQERKPVYVGLDGEFSFAGSTSAQAIRAGIQIAMDEINGAGGVLDGRPLRLIERDNRIVPARSRINLREFAATPDLVAVFCGRFSPTVIETVKDFHDLKIPLLNPWAAADPIVDHSYSPSYTFRLSLRDSWAMPVIADAMTRKGLRNAGLLFLNTSWGRSNEAALRTHLVTLPRMRVIGARWINNLEAQDVVMLKYAELVAEGADAIILVSNNNEAIELVKGMAKLDAGKRRPVYSHWGVTGGEFVSQIGDALDRVEFAVIQTYSFLDATRPQARTVAAQAMRMLGARSERQIPSPVGVAHAYDLTHILARAINLAKTTERAAIRDALENVRGYRGLIRDYEQPFSANSHEALSPADVFLSRFTSDGALERIR